MQEIALTFFRFLTDSFTSDWNMSYLKIHMEKRLPDTSFSLVLFNET